MRNKKFQGFSVYRGLGAIAASAVLVAMAGHASAAFLTPTIDGAGITAGNNGAALSLQTATPGFGAGLQLGEIFVSNDGTNLYVSIAGNNSGGGNGIYLFVDSIAGGATDLATDPSAGYGEFDVLGAVGGAVMPAGFGVDLVVNLKASDDGGSIGTWELAGNTASYRGNTGAHTGGYDAAIDNSNVTTTPWASGTVSTGIEIQIPLSEIGNPAPGSAIKLFAVAGNVFGGGPDNTTYLSNQLLPNTGSPGNFGRDGVGGDGVGTSFNGTGGPNVTPISYTVRFPGTPYSATGTGTSTIGTGGTYATLRAACDAINTAGSRDASTWTFEFVSNTTEPTNSPLSIPVDAAGSIVFKPAAGVSPTVTFTNNVDSNPGASGNFMIGAATDLGWPTASLGTKNIIIDGNNGTIDRALTFTNSGITVSNQAPVGIVGDADFITIKNARLINTSTGGASSAGIAIRPRFGTVSLTPNDLLIENNEITSTTASQGVGVNVTNSGTLPAGQAAYNFVIRDNDIAARIRGIFVNYGYGYTVEGNSISVGATANGFDSFGVYNLSGNLPPANTTIVRNNRIFVTNVTSAANAQGPNGLFMGSTGSGYDRVVEIYNNEVIVENTGARNAGVAASTRGIHMTSGISWRVHNNTVWILNNPAQIGASLATNLHGIGGFAVGSSNIEILNNVVVADLPNAAAISQNVTPTGVGSSWKSNYNTLFVSNGATVGKVVAAPAATLGDWRAASGGDARSDSFDPKADFTDSTLPGLDLTLTAAARNADVWGAAPSALATSDFQGDVRGATVVYRGFDELAAALAPTANAPTAPVLSASAIDENSANGTVVGVLSSTDADAGDTIILALTNNAGGAFALNASNEIVVANSALLDYEASTTLSIDVTATDEGFATTPATIVITINNIDEDTDGDGVLDSVEGADYNNAQATTLVSGAGAQTIRLTTDAGSLALVTSAASPGSEPALVSLPLGVVGFSVTGLANGGSATITLTYPNDGAINNAYKVVGTTYTELTGATVTGTSVTYVIVDGGPFDGDAAANGTIVDPVAPAIDNSSVTEWSILNEQ